MSFRSLARATLATATLATATLSMASLPACSPAAPRADVPVGQSTATSTATVPIPVPTDTPTATPTATASSEPTTPAGADDVARANDFAVRVFAKSPANNGGNVFVSPPSIRMALSAVYAGASGKTKDELAKGLGFDADATAALAAAKSEVASWNAPKKGAELTFATRLWVEKSESIGAAYQAQVTAALGAGLEPADFKGASEPSRALINAWVKKQTNNKIVDLLPPGSVTRDTRLVVTNAVYFLGKWQSPFDVKATQKGDFSTSTSKKKSVSMMHQSADFPYFEEGDLKVAGLPYGAGDMRMVILLGPSAASTTAIEKQLSSAKLASFHQQLESSSYELDVSMPKLEVHWDASLGGVLKALGVERVFTNAAELDSIAKGLQVSDVFHKTFVVVDEQGTEAAAATGVMVTTTSLRPPPKPFVVDHPFVFYIEDAKSGRVLFIGKVTDPTGG